MGEHVHWAYQNLVERTVRDFVARALPDAHDWEDGPYRIAGIDGGRGDAFRVEVDIPTSAEDCWLSFELARANDLDEMAVYLLQGLRSGRDGDAQTYEWRDASGAWLPIS